MGESTTPAPVLKAEEVPFLFLAKVRSLLPQLSQDRGMAQSVVTHLGFSKVQAELAQQV